MLVGELLTGMFYRSKLEFSIAQTSMLYKKKISWLATPSQCRMISKSPRRYPDHAVMNRFHSFFNFVVASVNQPSWNQRASRTTFREYVLRSSVVRMLVKVISLVDDDGEQSCMIDTCGTPLDCVSLGLRRYHKPQRRNDDHLINPGRSWVYVLRISVFQLLDGCFGRDGVIGLFEKTYDLE